MCVGGASFGNILGDCGGACLALGIHVSEGWQWGTGADVSGSELAHTQWWFGDISCLGIPLLLCICVWRE